MLFGATWYESIVDFLRNLFSEVVDFFREMIGGVVDTISEYVQFIVDAILGWFRWGVDIFISFFNVILQFCLDFIAWVYDGIIYFLQIGWDFFFGEMGLCWLPVYAVIDLFDWFLGWDDNTNLPLQPSPVWEVAGGAEAIRWMMDSVASFDDFLPVTELLITGLTFFGFIVVFLIVKAVLKLIPTVG